MATIVTGAGGFVGRALVTQLAEAGEHVIGIDNTSPDNFAGARFIAGDLADRQVRSEALKDGCEAIIHLATVPGGAAEADPAASRRVNVDAMYDLMQEVAEAGSCPRFVYASSIAVYGDPFPDHVDDNTPLSPKMIYGGHKAMMELALAMFSNRGMLDGRTIRLPGILARPKGPSGMKSAFLSNLFHALKAGEDFICPTSPEGTIWAQSVARCAANFVHALRLDSSLLPPGRAVTLPAIRTTMGDLIEEVARQCGTPESKVRYEADAELERAFAAQPPLSTHAADHAGFAHDGTLADLVSSALKTL